MNILHTTISLDPDLGGPPAIVARLADPQPATAMGLAARNLIDSRFT